MTSFLKSLKDDLLDRRLLPMVVVVVLGLVAAIGFVALGGGSSTATPSAPSPLASTGLARGLSVSRITPEKAVAETTGGVSDQRGGAAHDPFTPLPETEKKAAAKTAATSTARSSTPSASSEPSSAPSGAAETSSPTSPKPPAPPKPVYHVAVLFGAVPAIPTPESQPQLTPYENLKLLTPLPSAKQGLIVYRGVTAGGKRATFTIVSEAILKGQATCLPNATQCQAIALEPGQAEALEYLSASGEPQVYELQLVSITASKASGEGVQTILRGESKAGRELLRHEGLTELPGLRYSARQGVLVLAGHAGFYAHAHKH